MSNKLFQVAAVATFALMAMLGCERPSAGGAGAVPGPGGPKAGGPPPPPPVNVATAPVQMQTIPDTVDVVGTLYGDDETRISAKVPGRIAEISKDMGDRADSGATLVRIDPTDYELVVIQRELAVREALASLGLSELPPEDFDVEKVATVQRAKLQAENAKSKRDRGDNLFKQTPPLISEQNFSDLQTAYEVALQDYDVARLQAKAQLAFARARQSELASARQRLADTEIKAPGDGSNPIKDRYAIAKRIVSLGEYVREGDVLFELVADDPLKLRASVPERFLSRVKTGQEISVRVEGTTAEVLGKVSRVSPAVDIDSRSFQIEGLFSNTDRSLRPGAFARASIIVGQKEVQFVPASAVVSFTGLDRVYSVLNGQAKQHTVKLGPKRGDLIGILEGLGDADAVIVEGQNGLSDGAPVNVKSN